MSVRLIILGTRQVAGEGDAGVQEQLHQFFGHFPELIALRVQALEQALRRLRRAQPDDLDDELARAVASGVDEEVALWIAATSLLEHDQADAHSLAAPLVGRDPRWGAALDAAAAAIAVEDAR